MITIEELDRQLRHWQKAVDVIVANVYELYEHPAHRALIGSSSGGRITVTGESQQTVEQACETVSQLLLSSNELHGVVERAQALREQLPRIFRDEKLRQIEGLLNGPSIRLPATDVPLTRRGLLSEAVADGRTLSLQETLDTMVPAFEAAKRTIFEVDRIWTTLPDRVDAAEAELSRLHEAGRSGDPHDSPDWLELRRKMEAARAKVNLDPLGAVRLLEQEIGPALAQVQARLEAFAAERRQVEAQWAQAHALQRELAATHARAAAAAEDCRRKVETVPAPPQPLSDSQLEDAGRWLVQLETMLPQAATRAPAKVGVRRWLEAAHQHLDQDRAALHANQSLLDERQELRGRLDALHAKAAGSGLAEDRELAEVARAARALLYRRPTPLAEARELVARYQARLSARIAGRA